MYLLKQIATIEVKIATMVLCSVSLMVLQNQVQINLPQIFGRVMNIIIMNLYANFQGCQCDEVFSVEPLRPTGHVSTNWLLNLDCTKNAIFI